MPRSRQYLDPLESLPMIPTSVVEFLEESFPGLLPDDLGALDPIALAYQMGQRDVAKKLREIHDAQRGGPPA